ncbi:MAG: histidine kinase [Acidimicrobiales bacterium]
MSVLARPGVPVAAVAGAAGLIQVVGTVGAAHNQPDRRPLDALAVALVLAGPAALLGLRRAPLAVLAAAFAVVAVYLGRGYPYGPVVVSAGLALVGAVQLADRRRVWLVTAVGLAAVTTGHALAPGQHLTWWQPVAVAGWIGLLLAGAELVRARRLQLRQAALAAEQERQRQAGEVRLRVAQELHDTLAHTISLINVQASVALHLLDQQPEAARPALTEIKAASHDALGGLRAALEMLRDGDGGPAPTAPAPGIGDLDELVRGLDATGLDVRYRHQPPPDGRCPTPPVQLAAYRIVQEALTNVTRHARAATVRVDVRYRSHAVGRDLVISVADDGVGGLAQPGMGITGMRERAASVGGTVEAGADPGGGFRVTARLPVGR